MSALQTTKLYRIWIDHHEQDRFESITQDFVTKDIHIEAVIPDVLIQYDILLTEDELLVLSLSFKSIETMRIDPDGVGGVIYIISDQER